MKYTGVIIEESLEDKNVLKNVSILSTDIEPITAKHQTPQLKQWTLYNIEVGEEIADSIAKELSQSLYGDPVHKNWYADYKNDTTHYIIFRNKIFKIDRTSKDQYDQAREYGLSLGIPEYQVDFHPNVRTWER